MLSFNTMAEAQRDLSRSQAIPLVGPLFISPIKAVVSVAQTIAAVAVIIFVGMLAIIFENKKAIEVTLIAMAHASLGQLSFCYSIANMWTLGLVGYKVEKLFAPQQQSFFGVPAY
jgi:hypothetical protein